MQSSRTENRIKRRELIKEIIDSLIQLYAMPDNKIEQVRMVFLTNVKGGLESIMNGLNHDDRYIHGTHIYQNNHDETVNTSS